MQVIVFASSKGGVGKTTSALTLSSVLTHHNAPTTLIDADPNSPLAVWSKRFSDGVPAGLSVKTAYRTDVAGTGGLLVVSFGRPEASLSGCSALIRGRCSALAQITWRVDARRSRSDLRKSRRMY